MCYGFIGNRMLRGYFREAQLLLLEGATPDTVLEVSIAAGYEDAAWLPGDRLPEATPSQSFVVPMSEVDRVAERRVPVAGYEDVLRIQRAIEPGVTDLGLRHTDSSPARPGDYYHFEVGFSGGAWAMTSPRYVTAGAKPSDSMTRQDDRLSSSNSGD